MIVACPTNGTSKNSAFTNIFRREEMKLQEFKGTPNREPKPGEMRVTLNNRGVIHMNRHAFEAFGSPGAVKLFYEEHQLVIALKPEDVRHRNAFRVKLKAKKQNTRVINALPFCRHWKIRIERTVLFNEIKIDDEGRMLLFLDSTTRIRRRWN